MTNVANVASDDAKVDDSIDPAETNGDPFQTVIAMEAEATMREFETTVDGQGFT